MSMVELLGVGWEAERQGHELVAKPLTRPTLVSRIRVSHQGPTLAPHLVGGQQAMGGHGLGPDQSPGQGCSLVRARTVRWMLARPALGPAPPLDPGGLPWT
jgi:hypothetical protein